MTQGKKKVQPLLLNSKKIQNIGLVVRHHQPQADAFAVELASYILSRGYKVFLADESPTTVRAVMKAVKQQVRVVPMNQLSRFVEMILVLGGDGTFLSIARQMKFRSVPVLGINMGQLGFLTEIKKEEATDTLARIMEGVPARLSERTLLEVILKRRGRIVYRGPVVNDVVVSKGAIARILGVQLLVNGKWVHDVKADGLIVSTPTGSTAYSLAAGGPIIEPSMGAIVLTPICPHSLTQRPLVVSDGAEIQIHLKDQPGQVMMTLDGQDAVDMKEGDVVIVKKFPRHTLQIISSPTRDYFSILREKLSFGKRN